MTIISPIHPTRQFQIDQYFSRKLDYLRDKMKQGVTFRDSSNDALIDVPAPMDITLPFRPKDINELQNLLFQDTATKESFMRFIHFWDGPRQIFHFDPNLSDELSKTDLTEVPWEALRVPYDEFYIHFGTVLDETLQFGQRKYQASGAYVHVQRGTSAIEGFLDGSIHFDIATNLVEPNYEDAMSQMPQGFTLHDPAYTFSLSGKAGELVEDALKRGTETHKAMLSKKDEMLVECSCTFAEELELSTVGVRNLNLELARFQRGERLIKEALPLILNCIFYLTHVAEPKDAVFPPEAPKGLVEKLLKAQAPGRRRILAEDLERRGFTKIKFVAAPSTEPRENILPTGKTVRPHWRRGHWRRQSYGSGRSLVALKWIRPVMVNADDGKPASGRIYGVD